LAPFFLRVMVEPYFFRCTFFYEAPSPERPFGWFFFLTPPPSKLPPPPPARPFRPKFFRIYLILFFLDRGNDPFYIFPDVLPQVFLDPRQNPPRFPITFFPFQPVLLRPPLWSGLQASTVTLPFPIFSFFQSPGFFCFLPRDPCDPQPFVRSHSPPSRGRPTVFLASLLAEVPSPVLFPPWRSNPPLRTPRIFHSPPILLFFYPPEEPVALSRPLAQAFLKWLSPFPLT